MKREATPTPKRPHLSAGASPDLRAGRNGPPHAGRLATGLSEPEPPPTQPAAGQAPPSSTRTVEVVWADIAALTENGQVHCVGHYHGVVPQWAEKALDKVISGWTKQSPRRLLMTEMTQAGSLSGALGAICFFPWDPGKVVAVAGMGQIGTFRRPQLKMLAAGLARAVGLLPGRDTLSTVLIGSGQGNLSVPDAVAGLLEGVSTALTADLSLGFQKLRIVERSLDRALEIHGEALRAGKKHGNLQVRPDLVVGAAGDISASFGCSLLLASLADTASRPDDRSIEALRRELLDRFDDKDDNAHRIERWYFRLRKKLQAAPDRLERLHAQAMHIRFRESRRDPGNGTNLAPTRLTFRIDQADIVAAAITNSVTVTERRLSRRLRLVELISRKAIQSLPTDQARRAASLFRFAVPAEFRELIDGMRPLIVDHDRKLSLVPWEMLVIPPDLDGETAAGKALEQKPISIQFPLARQLRTLYSPSPSLISPQPRLSALVIGGPGDLAVDSGDTSLRLAQAEAIDVYELLRARGIDTTALIGLPQPVTSAPLVVLGKPVPPADYASVVESLLSGEFDLVHFCGHARFDPSYPESAGWYFGDDMLTARDLQNLERPPRLIFANACSSAGLSPRELSGEGLVAGLADECFRRGVGDFIGTAWEIPSEPACLFARGFYQAVLGPPHDPSKRSTIGEAVRIARESLFDAYGKQSNCWAAYQHYGDPTRTLDVKSTAAGQDNTTKAARKLSRARKR